MTDGTPRAPRPTPSGSGRASGPANPGRARPDDGRRTKGPGGRPTRPTSQGSPFAQRWEAVVAAAKGPIPTPKPLRERRLQTWLVVLAGAIPVLVGAIAAFAGWRATGDNALISIRVGDLLGGKLLTSGLPTTGENFGSGVASNHPGPMPFYLLAPFQAIYGVDAGLALGAAAINGAVWAVGVWVMTRRHGLLAGVVTLGIFGLLAFGLGAHLLYDPVSSNAAAFASIALVIVAAEVVAGDWDLLPVFVVLGSFVIQAHLTYVALGMPLVLVVIGALIVALVRRQPEPTRSLVTSAAIGLVLWAPVVWDQVFGTGNVSNIAETFTSGDSVGEGPGFALGRVLYAIAPVPMFARRLDELGYLADAGPVTGALGVVAILSFIAITVRMVRSRSPYAPLALLVSLALLTSAYSASQLPSGATVKAANLRWMWTAGALVWLVLLIAVVEAASRRWRSVDVFWTTGCFAIVAVLLGVSSYWTVDVRDARTFDAVDSLRSQIIEELDDGTYLVRYQGTEALLTIGPPIVSDLISRGYDPRVSLGPFDRAYGDHIVTKRLPTTTPVLLVVTAADGSEELVALDAQGGVGLIAESRFSPGEGRPDIVARVYATDVASVCGSLSELIGALASPTPERPVSETFAELTKVADTQFATIKPLLTEDQSRQVRSLIERLDDWEAELAAEPDRTIEEIVLADLDEIQPGVDVLVDLCGGS